MVANAALALAALLTVSSSDARAQTAPPRDRPDPTTSQPATRLPPENVGKPIGDPAAGFAQLDANGDGRISPTEAKASTELAAEFGSFDADGNGALSQAEYAAFVRAPPRKD